MIDFLRFVFCINHSELDAWPTRLFIWFMLSIIFMPLFYVISR